MDYYKRYPVGFPGVISRRENLSTESRFMPKDAEKPKDYGHAVKLLPNGSISGLESGDEITDVFGFLVCPNFATASDKPVDGYPHDVMRQGYMTVEVGGSGAVEAGGAVFIRLVKSGSKEIGQIEAAEVVDETVALPGARFVGPATAGSDSKTIAEICFNL